MKHGIWGVSINVKRNASWVPGHAISMARSQWRNAILCDVGWPKLGAKETQDQATSTKWSVELSSYPHFWRSLRGKHFRTWSKLNEMVNAAACILLNVFCALPASLFMGFDVAGSAVLEPSPQSRMICTAKWVPNFYTKSTSYPMSLDAMHEVWQIKQQNNRYPLVN